MSHFAKLSFALPDWPWLLAAAGAVALAIIVLLVWLIFRQPHAPAQRAGSIPLAEQRSIERDITSLMNDLAEMARQLNRQIDGRCARLEQLLRAADERIEQLSNAEQNARRDAPGPSPADGKKPDPDEPDPRHVEIYRLCDEGMGARQIAQRLDRPAGEIELIIALRPRRPQRTDDYVSPTSSSSSS